MYLKWCKQLWISSSIIGLDYINVIIFGVHCNYYAFKLWFSFLYYLINLIRYPIIIIRIKVLDFK